ncbi:Anaerobilin synthase [Myxococcaceae bacterium]|jgi:oxygen-independent coproporphyrinogen-3 oxidase|nr:Anaerobilin synthase [Myxococcaceae bacterium]
MGGFDPGLHFARVGGDPVRDAFPARRPVPPWNGRSPVAAEEIGSRWERALSSAPTARKRLAYVHVPFCANHCLFCGFYRSPARPEALDAYASLVIAELDLEASRPGVSGAPVHAVYLGGGTPTALAAGELARLLRALRHRLPLAPDCEITVEGRVLHFDPEKIDACLDAGANRFSIGVQTFDTAVRRHQGRRTSREELVRFLEALRDRERAAIVFDLLIGLPGQTRDVWRRDLETCIELEPDGVDLYALNVFPGTPLHRAIEAGKSEAASPLVEIGSFYAEGVERLMAAGWRQISNSHFARTTRERNLYNLLIKQGADCLAYGAGAGGSLGRLSYSIEPDPERWAAAIEGGSKPLVAMREAGPAQAVHDAIVAGLEQGRLDLARARVPEIERIEPLLAQWHAAGLLEDGGPVLRLTTAGRFWSTNLARALADFLAPAATGASSPLRGAQAFSSLATQRTSA